MALRILIDARHVRDFGFGTYTRNLIRSFARIRPEEEFLLVASERDREEFENLPEQFRVVPYERTDRSRLDHVTFPWLVHQYRPDLVHIPLNIVPLALPRPYIVTVHDLSSLIFEKRKGWKHSLHLFRVKQGLLRSNRVIAVSDATQRDVEHLLGIPKRLIQRIYGAPDPDYCVPCADTEEGRRRRSQMLERYQVRYPYLLYSGMIRPQKNIPRLIEAFAQVHAELEAHPVYKDLRLIIIGDEVSRHPGVRHTVRQYRVENHVRFLGFVTPEALRAFYEGASAFVFPSLYEGFGLPPLEAMASGVPVVCSDVASLPEVVGQAAVMVNPEKVYEIATAMKKVLLDKELRVRLVRAGYEQLRQFDWNRTGEEVLKVYREVAEGR